MEYWFPKSGNASKKLKLNKTRRGGQKFQRERLQTFTIMGNNTAGLKAKKDSLEALIHTLKRPSCIMLQETKLGQKEEFKLQNYQVFQKNRNVYGGGLLTAVDVGLNPMLISSKNEEAEVLTVQLEINHFKIRILNGYGPQEDDSLQNKLSFWMALDQEVLAAKSENCLVLIQMDANAKVGRKIIDKDPNSLTDNNGQKLLELCSRHELAILNADARCRGTITRYRVSKRSEEKSILDYMLVCKELYQYFESMVIDEERNLTLTKYIANKTTKKSVPSDHNPMFARFNIKYRKNRFREPRREIFNLKNGECQEKFFQDTSIGIKFQHCFWSTKNFEEKCTKFKNTLDDTLHKCFKKIRITKNGKAGGVRREVNQLIIEKNKLSLSLRTIQCKLGRCILENEINKIEEKIGKISASQNSDIVREAVKSLQTSGGSFSQLGMWKLKNLMCPKIKDPPMAKRDKNGSLITSPSLLKRVYLETYKERLKPREIKPELLDLFYLKSELWDLKLEELEANKTKLWSIEELERVLKSLKNNKTRDPQGLVNELFKPGIIGEDLKLGILELLNCIKIEQKIPKFMQEANITTIYKKKGSKQDLNNDRGIFVVGVLRMILDSLIYQDKYPLIDRQMSNSNIGARKNRNIRDHLFIVYAVINSVINGNAEPVDIQIYDVEKCFDVLWLKDCMLDLCENLPKSERDDKISLLYRMNIENQVAINTAVGQTERVNMPEIVMQGGKWGPLKCSNTMDKIGQKCEKGGKHLYRYNGKVNIMPLAMVDDLLVLAKCGEESKDVNIFVNSEIEMKKLRFHTPDKDGKSKCNTLHIGKKKMKCQDLEVHGCQMKKVENEEYLGDMIATNGKNTMNIEKRVSKGMGIISQIMDLLKNVNFGKHYFRIATTLRESMFVNGLITNCEVWHNLNESETKKFEELDRILIRKIFQVPSTCPVEALYLELGCIPLGITIRARRLNYLHHLVTRDKDEMLSKTFWTQWQYPVRGDWVLLVEEDLEMFGINNNLTWIKSKSKLSFKAIVKSKAKELALELLLNKKEKHSKMKNLQYTQIEMQKYLENENIKVSEARSVFKFRTRMMKCWGNFKGGRPPQKCPICKEQGSVDTQEHSFQCRVMKKLINIEGEYQKIFSDNVHEKIARTVGKIEKLREEILEE